MTERERKENISESLQKERKNDTRLGRILRERPGRSRINRRSSAPQAPLPAVDTDAYTWPLSCTLGVVLAQYNIVI